MSEEKGMTMQQQTVAESSSQGLSREEWLGIMQDVVNLGSTGAGVGMNIARQSTTFGFGIATGVLDGLGWMSNQAVGPNLLSMGLSGVSGIVSASEKITDFWLQFSSTIANTSLGATSQVLRVGGAKAGELLKVMGAASETVDTLVVVAKLMWSFGEGIHFNHNIVNDLYLISSLQYLAEMNIVPAGDQVSEDEIKEITRYLPHALSAYGKLFCNFMGINPIHNPMGIIKDYAKEEINNTTEEGKDAIGFISEMCNVDAADIMIHKTDTSPYDPSFFIALDRKNNAVILTFRGTLSLSDALTDLICDHEPYDIFGTEGFVHTGFRESAKRLSPRLEPMIYQALVKLNQEEPLSLIVTGHSLGAAMATVLMTHWLTSGTFVGIELQCYAYASPCVFSYSLSTHDALKCAIKSIIVKDDLVPRLCHGSAFDVRGRLLNIQELREKSSAEYKNLVDMIKSDDKMPKSNAAAVYKLLEPEEEPKMRLYPAGTIYYGNPLAENEEERLIHLPHELLSDILLSGTMLSDHMPNMYAKYIPANHSCKSHSCTICTNVLCAKN